MQQSLCSVRCPAPTCRPQTISKRGLCSRHSRFVTRAEEGQKGQEAEQPVNQGGSAYIDELPVSGRDAFFCAALRWHMQVSMPLSIFSIAT